MLLLLLPFLLSQFVSVIVIHLSRAGPARYLTIIYHSVNLVLSNKSFSGTTLLHSPAARQLRFLRRIYTAFTSSSCG
uniref:Putative secreted protein n=1 Tax=Anopheles marajoara TaxID=58244 RepID=A0A2M4CCG9_9DIPT